MTAADLDRGTLRSEAVSQGASVVAAIPEVRWALLAFQRAFGDGSPGAVLAGRDIGTIVAAPARAPRALTPDEQRAWIDRLHADEDARRKDLPDLCEWMLGTGVRIGEA